MARSARRATFLQLLRRVFVTGFSSGDSERPNKSSLRMAPVSQNELLLRRYSPTNPDHITTDEGTGKAVLNWSALEFDEDGCSVYREELLLEDGLNRDAILDPPYVGIATTTAAEVERFSVQTGAVTVQPFYVVASPRTEPPPVPTDRAHASIRVAEGHGLSTRKLDKARRRLGRHAFTIVE